MTCIKWSHPFACLFWVTCHPGKRFPQKKPWQESQNRPFFLPTTKPHLLNFLTKGPSPLYWLGASKWCSNPCVSSIILYVYLLLLPRHSCRSCLVSFCCMCWAYAYLPWCEGCMGFQTCIASFRFLSYRLGIVWVEFFALLAHWASSFAVHFPVKPMSLLAVIPTMSALRFYYLLSWASPTHLLYLYLLLHL